MSSATLPVTTAGDFYVPAFELKLRGRPAKKDVIHDVVSVSYKDSITDIDSFEVVINNWDAGTRSFKYSDDTLFDPGAEVELSMGYRGGGDLDLMITGEITSLRPSFPSGGQPTLTIGGLNLLHRFRNEQRFLAYTDKTDSEIAVAVGQRIGARVRTGATGEPRHKYVFQDGYDVAFLVGRARANGYDLFVEESDSAQPRLYFGPSTEIRRPTYELVYGRSLVEFQPELTTANQVGEVVVSGWDPIRQEKIEYRARLPELETEGITPGVRKSFENRKEIVADRVVDSLAEARQLAVELLQQIAKGLVKATGSTVGLPRLRAGSVIEVGGLGTRFAGRYFVTDTTHAISDSGYTTQFGCRREEVKGS
ncbi:phage late control D family protein [Actinoplanes sp. CA-015351]|uniref:phage late control D family protein n=1 Tax=Actinoplanes sp. CA-015351 TaxID=3239897 RepID=UPI003D982B22